MGRTTLEIDDGLVAVSGPRRTAAGLDPIATTHVHRLSLRFSDGELEREFLDSYSRNSLPLVRFAVLLALVQYGAFGLLDTRVVPNDYATIWVIRFAIVGPCLAALFALSFTECFARHQHSLICAAVVVSSVGLDAMMVLTPVPTDYIHAGTMLVLGYLFTFSRVRFTYSLVTGAVVIAGYEAAATLGATLPGPTIIYNNFFLLGFTVIVISAGYTIEQYIRRNFLREKAIVEERARSDLLLLNILPEEIAGRLKLDHRMIADEFDEVSVIFADIVNFTVLSEQLSAAQLVSLLDEFFTLVDSLCTRHGLEKIKTIGDAYMAVSGLPSPRTDHAETVAEMALDMLELLESFRPGDEPLSIRIGISSGPVVAGVIGRQKFAYDLWGDTVNTASRMESHGIANTIQVAEPSYERLRDGYEFSGPHIVEVKGKGPMRTYYLLDRRPSAPRRRARRADSRSRSAGGGP